MGLLDYITATSLDEDYAHVHQQRQQRGETAITRPSRAGVVVFLLFGLLIATAAVQTARTAGATRASHENLVVDVNASSAELDQARDRLAAARDETQDAQRESSRIGADEQAAARVLTRLGTTVGALPVSGPGVKIVVDDAEGATDDSQLVLDKDLRDIANGLWEAGAEAISINGQRLTTTSAIRVAGDAITVNYEDIAAPYTVQAIGNPDTLAARFVESTSGARWLDTSQTLGLRSDMTSEESMRLPAAAPQRLTLRRAMNKADQVEGDS